jgi:hypothetical protein
MCVPPLREHPEDIPELADHLLAKLARHHKLYFAVFAISKPACDRLAASERAAPAEQGGCILWTRMRKLIELTILSLFRRPSTASTVSTSGRSW